MVTVRIFEQHLFVPRTGTSDHLVVLQHTLTERRICTIFGPGGSGKTELFLHWREALPEPVSVIHIELSPPSDEFRSIPHMVYARLLETILNQTAPAYLSGRNANRGNGEHFGKRPLEELRKRLVHELNTRPITGLALDRIEFLDLHAASWFLDLRYGPTPRGRSPRRALFFIGQLRKVAEDRRIDGWLRDRGDTRAAWTEPINVRRPTLKELRGTNEKPGIARRLISEGVTAAAPDTPERSQVGQQLGELIELDCWESLEPRVDSPPP